VIVEFFNIEVTLDNEKVELADVNGARPAAFRLDDRVYVSSRALSSLLRVTVDLSLNCVMIKSDHLGDGTPISLEYIKELTWGMTEKEVTNLLGYPFKCVAKWGRLNYKYNLADGKELNVEINPYSGGLITAYAKSDIIPPEPWVMYLHYNRPRARPTLTPEAGSPTPSPEPSPTPSPTPSLAPTPHVKPVWESIKAVYRGIKVTVEGKTSDLYNKAVIHNGIIYLPLIEVATNFGTEASWIDQEKVRLSTGLDTAEMRKVEAISYDDLNQLKLGMTMEEVVAIIGPSQYDRGSGKRFYCYLMEDGKLAYLLYSGPKVTLESVATHYEGLFPSVNYIMPHRNTPTPLPPARPQY
jgi:outer membrane protein assembly factor BamE (lipoprotein component of BamABCDE complex)